MDLRKYLSLVVKWLWLILLFPVVGGITAYFVSQNTPPSYQASTTILISSGNSNPASAPVYNDPTTSDRITRTYAEWLTKRPILEEVINRLKLKDTAAALARKVTVQPVRDTQMLTINVEDRDPRQAVTVANDLPQVFITLYQETQSARFVASEENLTKNLATIQSEVDDTRARLLTLRRATTPENAAEIDRLDTVLAQQRSTYAGLLKSYEDVRLAQTQSQDNIVVVEPAILPSTPIKPNRILNTLTGAALGLILTFGIILLGELLDDTLKTAQDVRQALGLSVLGTISKWSNQRGKERPITATQRRSSVAEAYRALRTNIQVPSINPAVKKLLVTSTALSEGKSSTAANLAVVMAQSGQSVLLIDSNLRRPSLHRLFGLSNSQGLSTALMDHGKLDGLIQATDIENLRIIPSGPIPPNPSELLGSETMKGLIQDLGHQADVIVFDSPPALVVTDASLLASQVDGVLLVLDAGHTRRDTARRVQESLSQVDAHVLGAVLNKFPVQDAEQSYQYNWPGTA